MRSWISFILLWDQNLKSPKITVIHIWNEYWFLYMWTVKNAYLYSWKRLHNWGWSWNFMMLGRFMNRMTRWSWIWNFASHTLVTTNYSGAIFGDCIRCMSCPFNVHSHFFAFPLMDLVVCIQKCSFYHSFCGWFELSLRWRTIKLIFARRDFITKQILFSTFHSHTLMPLSFQFIETSWTQNRLRKLESQSKRKLQTHGLLKRASDERKKMGRN